MNLRSKYYQDGAVDIENSVAMDLSGVTYLKFPRLALAAQVLGTVTTTAAVCLPAGFHPVSESWLRLIPAYKTRRKIGYAALACGGVAGAALIGESNAASYGLQAFSHLLDKYVAMPLEVPFQSTIV